MSRAQIFEISESLYNKTKRRLNDEVGGVSPKIDFTNQRYHQSELFFSVVATVIDCDDKYPRKYYLDSNIDKHISINMMFTQFSQVLRVLHPNTLHEITIDVLDTFGYSLDFNEYQSGAFMYKWYGKIYVIVLSENVESDEFFRPFIIGDGKKIHKMLEFLAL